MSIKYPFYSLIIEKGISYLPLENSCITQAGTRICNVEILIVGKLELQKSF